MYPGVLHCDVAGWLGVSVALELPVGELGLALTTRRTEAQRQVWLANTRMHEALEEQGGGPDFMDSHISVAAVDGLLAERAARLRELAIANLGVEQARALGVPAWPLPRRQRGEEPLAAILAPWNQDADGDANQ